jgi:hypothetical protein
MLGISCILVSTLVLWQEIGEINRKLPEDEKVSYLWMYSPKRQRIKEEYRRFYPRGPLDRLQFWLEIAGFIFFLLSAFKAGFFHHWLGP